MASCCVFTDMNQKDFSKLLDKYLRGECTPEEEELILKWYHQIDEPFMLMEESERKEVERRLWRKIRPGAAGRSTPWLFRIAAVFALFAAVFCIYVFVNNTQVPQPGLTESETVEGSSLQFINPSKEIQIHRLSDGSEVTLYPGSELTLEKDFPGDVRSVHLTGEAFFSVKRDTLHPFIVYSRNVITKVLGTSFNVKAYASANEVAVRVKTGLVSVTAKDDDVHHDEVLLKPNQEAIYSRVSNRVTKKLVDQPQIVLEKPTLFTMEYDGAPVNRIFQVLEENYGVDILYDEATFSNCVLTTSLTDEGLYERIAVICKAIGAEYELQGTAIVIKGNGCQ